MLAAYFVSCSSSNIDPNPPCESVAITDHNLHDTSKVVFEGRIAFDTTANQVSGKVIDRETFLPVNNAHVLLKQDNREFIDTTSAEGKFSVFQNNFFGMWTMTITDADYKCLIIDSVEVDGGLELTIKLKK